MNATIFRYGLFAALTILILACIHVFLLLDLDYSTQEVFGYLTMLLSMIFVFLGIRHYRNHVNHGVLSFGEGLKIGTLIVLIPAVFFGLFDVLYTEVINPGWKNDYYNDHVELIRQNTPTEKVESELKKLQKQRDMFASPALQFLLMAGTVFVIGFIVTIISSLSLRRKSTVINSPAVH